MAEREYRRLTRSKARTLFGIVSTARSSLWLGKDHLLCIDTTGYTENYKRFYYRDIQAIIIRRTEVWKVTGLVLGLVTLFFAMVGWLIGEPVAWWIFGSVAGLFGVGTILNFATGPSCACYLRTAVQTEELISLGRVRRARRALTRLRPLIDAAQGQLAPEELPARYSAWLLSFETGAPAPAELPIAEAVTPQPAEDIPAPPRIVEETNPPPRAVDDPNAPPRIVP